MKIIDLTLTVSDKIPTFPGSPQPSFIPWENVKEDGYTLELLFQPCAVIGRVIAEVGVGHSDLLETEIHSP